MPVLADAYLSQAAEIERQAQRIAELEAELAQTHELLKDAAEWMRENPPANSYGLLDKGADREQAALRQRIYAIIDEVKRDGN